MNRSSQTQTVDVPLSGYMPDGVRFAALYGPGNTALNDKPKDNDYNLTVSGSILRVTLNPMSGLLLATRDGVDLTPPSPPDHLRVSAEGNGQVSLAWDSVASAVAYRVYRSPLSGGGWVLASNSTMSGTALSSTTFTDTGLRNAQTYYYVVTALDSAGNESRLSGEVSAMPRYTINRANLQWPPTLIHAISAITPTEPVYGRVGIDGVTNQSGPTPSLRAQLGFGPVGSNPAASPSWTWVEATFNVDADNSDEFVARLMPETIGGFDYVYRYTTTNGRDWLYADLNGLIANGALPSNPGKLTVNPSADTTPPATPANLRVSTASPDGIGLAWDAVAGDPTLYGYEVLRGDMSGGPYTTLALVTGASVYLDTAVTQGATYYYVVRAVDTSLNRSAPTTEVSAAAQVRTVSLVFNVTVPATTDATGRLVHIAGFLDRLDGNLPQWDPGATPLTRMDATHWSITLTGKEGTQIEYKYTLGDWEHVEKDASCGEIGNRQLTLAYGSTGTQVVNDTAANWRNVAPCGN
jgi:fibronectin type 3 domain-containing protein